MIEILLEDDFSALEIGQFSTNVGAHTEYHYLPEAAPKGNWAVVSFNSGGGADEAWKVQPYNGAQVMAQTYHNPALHTHPMLASGEPLWGDYTVTMTFTPEAKQGQVGMASRFHNSRCYYFFGLTEGELVLKFVQHETAFHEPYEEILASTPCAWETGHLYTAHVTIQGNQIQAEIEGLGALEATDKRYQTGGVALLADSPTLFHSVKVTTSGEEKARFNLLKARQERELEDLRAANPKPVLWKKISTKGFGAGRNLRFGDLNGDGQIDVLIGQVKHHHPGDQYSELSCLTAMTFDGDILWQIGAPNPDNYHLTNDVGFQIHDIDGDGRNEVIYCINFEIVVVDGTTGKVKYKAPTPFSKPPANRYPRILRATL